MKLTRLLPFVAAAALLLPAGVATAQPSTGPDSAACATAQAGVRAKADAALKATEALEAAAGNLTAEQKATIAKLQDEFAALQVQLNDALTAMRNAPSQANTDAAIALGDKLNAKAAQLFTAGKDLGTATQALIDANAALKAALATQKTACAGDDTPPTTPTTPSPTPSVPPTAPADDVDCADVSQARAQEILDAYRSDPNKLDGDHDGTACELDEGEDTVDLTIPAPADGTSQVSVLPQGGVDTGW